ncbi:MAG: VOC family protein [Nitrososphaerota archaeon]|nr:VOC family protein [Nitrososphaerota archaeon]
MSLIGQLPLAAIRLQCKDIEDSKRFYRDVVGLKSIVEEEEDDGIAHFDIGNIRLTLKQNPPAKDDGQKPATSGQLIFLVENAIDQVCADLQKRGVKFRSKKISEDSSGKTAWFNDPDGNIIYLWQPPKRESKSFKDVESVVKHYESISRAVADLREVEDEA